MESLKQITWNSVLWLGILICLTTLLHLYDISAAIGFGNQDPPSDIRHILHTRKSVDPKQKGESR